jgi:hypothetical protein
MPGQQALRVCERRSVGRNAWRVRTVWILSSCIYVSFQNQVTGETCTHNDRGHNPALCLLELRPQRRWLDLNQRKRELQSRALPLGHIVKHAAQGSNLPFPALETGAPPLALPA